MRSSVLIIDIGATNVRALAVGEKGNVLHLHAVANETAPDPEFPGGKIWPVETMWQKVKECVREVLDHVEKPGLSAVTITTFGVDGAPVDQSGNLLYPVISWACDRTVRVMKNIESYIPLKELFQWNGLQPMHYNTISKLIWFKENKPKILESMNAFLFLPSLLIHRLTGESSTDSSMAGTSQLTDNRKRNFSPSILGALGLHESVFPNLLEPGRVAGRILRQVSEETGIPEGLPVVVTGHDTQFAVFGSKAELNQPVLSSGTWEVLMVRVQRLVNTEEMMTLGVTTELDPVPGFFNTGLQWIASGAVEWVKKTLFAGQTDLRVYETMVREAEAEKPGAGGVFAHPAFVSGIGPSAPFKTRGSILGLGIESTRGQVYRAVLESLACQTRQALEILERAAGFKAKDIICVGGGSKNRLWNQLRADLLGVPVRILDQKETTALGAAMFAFVGAGVYKDPDEARQAFMYNEEVVHPSSGRAGYEPVFDKFKDLARNLAEVYKN